MQANLLNHNDPDWKFGLPENAPTQTGGLELVAESTSEELKFELSVEGQSLAQTDFRLTLINETAVELGQTITLPSQAELIVHSDSSVTYNPGDQLQALSQEESTIDYFTYTVVNDSDDSITSQMVFTIANTQGLMLLEDGYVMTRRNSPVTFPALTNLAQIDPEDLSIELLNQLPGETTVHTDGNISFLPRPGYIGTVTLHYFVENTDGEVSDATVTIDVIP